MTDDLIARLESAPAPTRKLSLRQYIGRMIVRDSARQLAALKARKAMETVG